MNKIRTVIAGSLVWVLIVISFGLLEFVPFLGTSLNLLTLFVTALTIPYAILGASFYYKNENKANGLIVGIIMSLIALVLDAFITVPFIEMPKGGSYQSFYTYPLLWLLVGVNTLTIYLYWRLKIHPKQTADALHSGARA